MICTLSDEELWSGLDRNAPDLAEHIAQCASCRDRAAQFQEGISAITASATVSPTKPLPAKIGQYLIRRRLGEGGMGIVYEGQQQNPKRQVAIKVVRGGRFADPYRVRLFQREAHTLARLKHPAIAAIYHAGQTDEGEDYFAMELVRGIPLNEFVRQGNLPRNDRLTLFRKVCEAINYAHQRGVIHRDLKPSNILVDAMGNPKILDFGLARINDPEAPITTLLTDVGKIMGTLPYMSPEEARGDTDEVDVRSDVYSLGVILYELLTDQLPYKVKRAALAQAVRVICEAQPQKPSAVDRSLRGDLEKIMLKSLQKEPDHRYQSAIAFADDLHRYQTNQPILARRANTLYHIRKFIARHKVLVLALLGSIALTLGVRMWVERSQSQLQESAKRVFLLQELQVAVLEYKLAETLYLNKEYDTAEPHYRNAVVTFRRLGDNDRLGPALNKLGTLLTDRPESSANLLEDAADFFWEALDIFDSLSQRGLESRAAWRGEKRKTLNGLLRLYGPEMWDDPDTAANIQAELNGLSRPPVEPSKRPPA